MRVFISFVVLSVIGVGIAWYVAGRAQGPTVEIAAPVRVGQAGMLVIDIKTPRGKLTSLEIAIEQNGKRSSIFDLRTAKPESIRQEGDRIRITQPIGKREVPALEEGKASIDVAAMRPVLFGLRQVAALASRDIEVRLRPPLLGVQSAFHYINLGGSEMVVYKVEPADVESGVRVGEYEYFGYPASDAGVENADPGLKVAFFALLWDQDVKTPIELFAHDDAGNEARATFDYRVFPKKFRKSRITIDDLFLTKVVPEILRHSPELETESGADLLQQYLRVNRDLRRMNNTTIVSLSKNSEPRMLWRGAFKQLVNTAVEAGFADQRTYVYNDAEVDSQVHLGFDLASTANAVVHAANDGKVVYAGWLGIYGNCVILDHGMGLQSIYAHLSSLDVKGGDSVAVNASLGRTGRNGLAIGDHVHFTMLLAGNPVSPIDWWSPKWIQDRIMRKLRDAEPVRNVSSTASGAVS